MCLSTEHVCVCLVRDVEVHKKLSRLKDGKFTNFVVTVNVF